MSMIAFIGLGIMGGPMARHLVETGSHSQTFLVGCCHLHGARHGLAAY